MSSIAANEHSVTSTERKKGMNATSMENFKKHYATRSFMLMNGLQGDYVNSTDAAVHKSKDNAIRKSVVALG